MTPILPSEEEEAVGCSICIPLGRLALDPRENTRVFLFQIEAEIAEHAGEANRRCASRRPRLCAFVCHRGVDYAASGSRPTSAGGR